MNDDTCTRLEQRIARLEIANRRWRRFATCAVVGLGCLGVMGAQKENVIKATQIEAQRIVVRDAKGKELVTLGKIFDNYAGMQVQYPGSRSNASFYVGADHATISLMDNNGASSITLNSGGAKSAPDLSIVKVGPGTRGPADVPGPVTGRPRGFGMIHSFFRGTRDVTFLSHPDLGRRGLMVGAPVAAQEGTPAPFKALEALNASYDKQLHDLECRRIADLAALAGKSRARKPTRPTGSSSAWRSPGACAAESHAAAKRCLAAQSCGRDTRPWPPWSRCSPAPTRASTTGHSTTGRSS